MRPLALTDESTPPGRGSVRHGVLITLGEAVIIMNEIEIRKALEARRKVASDPTLAPGDVVFYNGAYAEVLEIKRHAPGAHDNSPIRNDWTAVQVVTDGGGSRWHGIEPPAPQSGYTDCACRDCMDTAISSDVSKRALCDKCKEADCRDWDSQVGQEPHRLFECQRDDAYGEA